MYLRASILISALLFFTGPKLFAQQRRLDFCQVYGGIYFVEDRNKAHFTIYIDEESGGLSDLIVFRHSNPLYADRSGQWFITETKAQANYFVYREITKSRAHFSIFYTDTESMAGCQ